MGDNMKKIIIVLLIGILLLSGCSCSNEKSEDVDKIIDETLNNMTLDEKIGQMMIVYYLKDEVDLTLRSSLSTVKPGGFILFGENITTYDKTLEFIKKIKTSNKVPMFIAIDEEGGKVQRLTSLQDTKVSYIPGMYYLGQMDDLRLTKDTGKVIAEELKVFGINMDFAPVIDIFENEENTVIGKRSFGNDYETVSKHGIAMANSLREYGIIPVYKHFPGHGNTSTDSHIDLPVVTKSKEELLKDELIPFKNAIENNAEIIMIGHLAVPEITGDNTPASLSKEIITDLLKNEMGYKGLVITDALNMGAITKNYSGKEIYEKAINAGVDILLMPSNSKEALNFIKESISERTITEERINESVRKILKFKYERIEDTYNDYLDKSYLNNKEHQDILNKIKIEED